MRSQTVFRVVALGLGLACTVAAVAFASAPPAYTPSPISPHEHRLADLLASGGLPRDRAMHAWLARFHAQMGEAHAVFPGELRRAAADAPRDRLVQWLWANADDATADCTPAAPCDDRAMALARLEPGNGAAWLPALGAASRRGDADGTSDLVARMADASTFDVLFVDSAEAWYAAEALVPLAPAELAGFRSNMGPGTTGEGFAITAAIARAAAFPIPSLKPLADACRPDRDPRAAERRDDCVRIGRTMLASGTMVPRSMGYSLLERMGAATPADAEANRRSRWLATESNTMAPTLEANGDEMRRYFSDLLATRDEYQAMERRIVRGHGRVDPPVDWARGVPPVH
jgi:hypothetical protein